MYNANIPDQNELPSSRQLLISTLAAFITATILLVVAILPAEYGVDPTGLGRMLGLTQMGEIKAQLAEEAAAEDAQASEKTEQPTEAASSIVKSVTTLAEESMSVTLAPGDAAEVKLIMNEADKATYSWTVDKGHVNFDTHGDNANTSYHNYSKAKAVTSDEGELIAAFDGSHGWFWRNRSEETVTVKLNVTGEFSEIKRVL